MKLVPIKENDKQKSYCKYISEPEIPSKEEIEWLVSPKDAAGTLEFADRRKIFETDFVPEDPGCYVLKTGGIVISSHVAVPDLSKEMMDWWMVWHQFDALRYALWDPQDHYDVGFAPEDREKLLDESVPYGKRIWNVPCRVLESFNREQPEVNVIKFCNPARLGYDETLIGTENCLSMICSLDFAERGPLKIPTVMTEILRKGQDGKNIWVAHWWLGAGVDENGNDVTTQVPVPILSQIATPLIVHNQIEMRHLNKVLPKLYAEYHDKPLEVEL